MDIRFSTYNDFLTEYQTYKLDKCSNCEGVRELIDDDVTVVIENRTLHFPELLVLCCNKCGDKCLPEYSKQIIDGAYKSMIEQEQFVGEFVSKSYKKKFEYCKETDYKYDHKDYYNIPGLCYDEEHSTEGFLTPVYFDRKALIYFISVPDFEVDIFSETYGHIGKKDPEGVYIYDLAHLDEECSEHAKNIKRPLVFTEQSVSGVINAFDKVLVEGFNVGRLRELYEALYSENERDAQYGKWQSIRLIKEILLKFCNGIGNTIDVEKLISPLYILHDYRIYFDHLLSMDKQESTKAHIVETLGVQNFSEQEAIYLEEIDRLNKLFQYLVLLSK